MWVPYNEISAEWGAQRIKGLSIKTALAHLLKKAFGPKTDSIKELIAAMQTDVPANVREVSSNLIS